MKGMWRLVSTVCAALLVLGAAAFGIGIFTGASGERIVELCFGGWTEMMVMLLQLAEEARQLLWQLEPWVQAVEQWAESLMGLWNSFF